MSHHSEHCSLLSSSEEFGEEQLQMSVNERLEWAYQGLEVLNLCLQERQMQAPFVERDWFDEENHFSPRRE